MQAIKLLPLVPFCGKADTLLNELSFCVVRNAVICIDDIERKETGLSVADVFGLACFLKEERSCKVVLVATDKKLPLCCPTHMDTPHCGRLCGDCGSEHARA